MPEHVRLECEDDGCDGCNLCELFACAVCGGAEGSLTTNCPGRRVSSEMLDQVYDGWWDYRDARGGWCVPDGRGRSMGDQAIRAAGAVAMRDVEQNEDEQT